MAVKKVTGLSVNFAEDCAGLFGYINGWKVTRLTVQIGVNGVNGSSHVGGIVGHISNGSITEAPWKQGLGHPKLYFE